MCAILLLGVLLLVNLIQIRVRRILVTGIGIFVIIVRVHLVFLQFEKRLLDGLSGLVQSALILGLVFVFIRVCSLAILLSGL